MINIETLLSSFDERGTLLKWLKAVEKALNEATLTSVDVITISTQQIQLQFNFEDGTHLTTPTITLPKGDKGDTGETGATGQTGATGVGVENVTVNASNHLIVTLTDETEIDAGEINVTSGVVIDTSMSASSENPVQNKVIYTALAGKQDVIDATHKLSADNVDDTSTTNKFVTASEKSTWNGKQNALTTSSVSDGTINKSIGFDSQGNIVKGSAGGGGGGSQLYKHSCGIQTAMGMASTIIICEDPNDFTDLFDVFSYGTMSADSMVTGETPQTLETLYDVIITISYQTGCVRIIGFDSNGVMKSKVESAAVGDVVTSL